MDSSNARLLRRLLPDDPEKIRPLLDRDVADPWYTGILENMGRPCRGLHSDYGGIWMNQEILEKSWRSCPVLLPVLRSAGAGIFPARPVDLRARMPHVRQKLGVPSRRRQRGDMSGKVYAPQKLPDDRHRHGGPRHRRHQPDPRHPRRPRGYDQSGGRLLPGTGCGTLYPIHGILRHLPRCAIEDGLPCRHPERMHPCVESQGINIIPTLERCGIEFQYGDNVVTWISLLLFEKCRGSAVSMRRCPDFFVFAY